MEACGLGPKPKPSHEAATEASAEILAEEASVFPNEPHFNQPMTILSHHFHFPTPLCFLLHFLPWSLPSPFSLRPPILHPFLASMWTHPHYFNCPISFRFPPMNPFFLRSWRFCFLLCIHIKKQKKCLELLQYI